MQEGAAFGKLHVHADLAFVGTYPNGWLEDGGGGGGGGGGSSNGAGAHRASPRKAPAKKDDGVDDWGADTEEAKAKARGGVDNGDVEEVDATQTQGEVKWEET